jgi:hypothetical protein
MKILTTDAQVWWIAYSDEIRPPEGFDFIAAMNVIKNTFEFPVLATGPARQGGGAEFDNGAYRATTPPTIITKLTVFGDGLNINVPSNTKNAQIILEKALEIFYSFGIRQPINPPLHYYLSTIIVDFDRSMDHLISNTLLAKIARALPATAAAHFAGININMDKTALPPRLGGINPTLFSIHRREGIPYDQNRYFSQANMATDQHIELLREFEEHAAKSK